MQLQHKYARLRNMILVTTLVFALIPMLLVGVAIPLRFNELYKQKIMHEVENIARAKGKSIDIFFEERITLLKSVAGMYSYEELIKAGRLSEVLRVLKGNSQAYIDLGIIDVEGNHIAYAGSYNVLKVNYKNEQWFSAVQRNGIYVSDVFLGFRNFPHIIIAVLREDGERSWILRATIDSAVFASMVQSSRVSENGEAFVINRKSELQTPSRKNGVMDQIGIIWPVSPALITVEEDFLGNSMIIAKVPLANAPWVLVVAENAQKQFAELFNATAIGIVAVLAGIIALGIGTWLTTRMIVNRLILTDKEKAELDAAVLQSSKMAALGKMAAGVAHEINNPLMLIREYAGWIKDLIAEMQPQSSTDMTEMKNSATKVEQNVDRAKDVTHRLLGFARRVDPKSESLLLSPIIDQAIGFLQNEANYQGVLIDRDYAGETLRIRTDIGQLQQVVLNVLDNAIDACSIGGKVLVSTGMQEDGKIIIRVQDNGPGIPEHRIGSIFDPFYTTKEPGEGTGLGLSICYSIMEGLGGSITAANSTDGGAVLTILLPKHINEQ